MSSVVPAYNYFNSFVVIDTDIIGSVSIQEDGLEIPVPMTIPTFDGPHMVFAFWHRVITHHLSKGNFLFVFENNLFDSFERSLGGFQVMMESLKTEASIQEINIYRNEFNRVVSWFNELRHPHA